MQSFHLCKLRIVDVGGGSVSHRSNDGYAMSNISLRWMIREIVAAGHHDLFSAKALAQDLFPRITIPQPSLLTQQSPPTAQGAGMQEDVSDPLDIDDLKQGIKRWVPDLKGIPSVDDDT
jgi:hypothetical protein